MSDLESWQAANTEYLAKSMAWLREQLERLGTAPLGPEIPVHSSRSPPPTAGRSWLGRMFGRGNAPQLPSASDASVPLLPAKPTALPPPNAGGDTAARPPALVQLAARLGLSELERCILLLCAAMELDTRTGALCARAQHDPAKAYPTFSLSLTLFDQPAWDVMSPERPLRYWRLIEINQSAAQPLITSPLRADERIVSYIKGLNYLDERLSSLVTGMLAEEATLPPSQQALADEIANQLRARATGRLPIIQLLGEDSESKILIAQAAAAKFGFSLFRLSGDAVPTQTPEHDLFARLWEREAALLPLAIYIDAGQTDRSAAQFSAIHRLVSRVAGVTFLDVREPWTNIEREEIGIEVGKPTPSEQKAAWVEHLGSDQAAAAAAERYASHFNFNLMDISHVMKSARADSADDPSKAGQFIWKHCLRKARPALDQLAHRIEPKAGWAQLELPETEKGLLRHVAAQVEARAQVYDRWGFRARMNRGLGISVLFTGDPGTGKTMAAEVIARELDLLLYKIDLSAVVSKYIGETEKSLRRLFDAAEDGGAILFFDEADALFGKRSEVKDSHDRYANIEVNYLLQRMEAYRGLAILATNMKGALDNAFIRRLRFVVNFPFPGPAERLAIWQKVFPEDTPLAAIDFQRLAKLNLTGGSIHNIALHAAFLAVQGGGRVTMQHLLEAARTELRKLEKPVNEVELRWLESVG